MMSSRTLRQRAAKSHRILDTDVPCWPEGRPENPLEDLLQKLASDKLNAKDLSSADAVLARAILGNKCGLDRKEVLVPASLIDVTVLNEQLVEIDLAWKKEFARKDRSLESCAALFASRVLAMKIPGLESSTMKNSIIQYVNSHHSFRLVARRLLTFLRFSLSIRYHLMFAEDSNITLKRVKFGSGLPVCFGMRAKKDIPSSVAILRTATNVAADDPYRFDRKGTHIPERVKLSVIKPHHGMKTSDSSPRIMLGPLRFVNHDCNPNAEVSDPLPQVIVTDEM
jgi:hypothetical protein